MGKYQTIQIVLPSPTHVIGYSPNPGAPINKVKLANHRRQALQDTQETSLSTVSKPLRTSSSCFCYDCCTRTIIHPTTDPLLKRTNSVLECTATVSDNISMKSICLARSPKSGTQPSDGHRRYYFGTLSVHSDGTSNHLSGSTRRNGETRIGLVNFWQRVVRLWSGNTFHPASNNTNYSNPDYYLGATLKL